MLLGLITTVIIEVLQIIGGRCTEVDDKEIINYIEILLKNKDSN